MNSIPKTLLKVRFHAAKSTTTRPVPAGSSPGKLATLALCLASAAAIPAFAQTTNVFNVYNVTATTVPAQVNSVVLASYTTNNARLTVGVNETGTNATLLRVTLGGGQTILTSSTTNFVDPDYFITNHYDLNPAVATLAATGVPATGGGAGVVLGDSVISNTNAGNAGFDVSVTLNYTNLASGDYDMAVEASGANTWRYPLPVKAGYQWSAGGGANTNFNNPANWVGGVVPGANDIVILGNAGAVVTNGQPTIAVLADTTVSSVSDIHTGDEYVHWYIEAGATLSVLGDGGFRQLIDIIDSSQRSRIRASGPGTMVISNANAKMLMFSTRQSNKHDPADFSNLNTLIVDVSQISFNDIANYPLFGTNGIANRPSANVYDMDWAQTNILRATFANPGGYTANISRNYSMSINREVNATTTDSGMHFGLWNELYMDSILFGGPSQMVDSDSRTDFRAAGSYLKLRAPDKISRMANITIADAYLTNATSQNAVNCDVRFDVLANGSASGATVDALLETLIVGRDPFNTANGRSLGRLFLGGANCVFDVNTAFIGYQTGPGTGTEQGHASGEVHVSSNAVFRVNDTAVLGYTVTNSTPVTSGFGRIIVNSAGLALINSITVGGPANASAGGNDITINAGGTLVVTNAVGSATARLNTLTMNNATLTVFPDAGTNAPCVFTTQLTTGGAGNTLRVAALTGTSTYPVTVPLISYMNPVSPNFTLQLPAGFYGYVVNNSANSTIDAVISTTPPQNLVWNGNVNGNWDQATANWQESKVFVNGDAARFDDTATGTTAVTVAGTVTVGSAGVLVTNESKTYSLSGGTIAGSAILTKAGANTLTIDSTTELAVVANGGTVDGSGTLGATTIGTNATLDYSGTINGLTTRGHSTSSGTINIGLSVAAGIMDNAGTVSGTFATSGGSVTTNRAGGTITHSGVATIGAGTMLINEGQINNGSLVNVNSRLSINGYLTGSGTVTDNTADPNVNNGRLEINAGGVFTPGGSNTIGTFIVEGRFDLNTGNPDGLMIIDVDLNHPAKNDVIGVVKWSNMRGALQMNNIGSIPFAAGQSFLICSNIFGSPNTPETAFDLQNKITPGAPGVGLQWDLSNLRTNGIIAVVPVPTTQPTLTNAVVGGTNLTLNWPTTHRGYQLQVQTNSLAVGLNNNWVPVVGSENSNTVSVAIDPASPTVFYRLSNQ
ncbi:MAG TPA: hypothetical protein VFZ59_19025 [Verrucomicrobiae bacterium]|nr:hypothetical protein [Verrucomicrobiae bacterium]